MKAYIQYFKLTLMTGLQYRVAAYAGMATQFFWGFMYLMIFEAFYMSSTGNVTDFSFSQMASYIWLQQAFLALIMTWFRDNELFSLITGGNLAYELCRPISLYRFWFAKLLGKRLSAAALRFAPILLVAALLPEPYRLDLPSGPLSALLFLISMAAGVLVMVALSMFIYLLTMKTMSGTGALLLFAILGDFLSGSVIPLPLMPEGVRAVIEWLPFRFTADFPFRVYSGHIQPAEAVFGIAVQILWLVVLVALGSVWMRQQLKHVVVQGG